MRNVDLAMIRRSSPEDANECIGFGGNLKGNYGTKRTAAYQARIAEEEEL